MYDSLKVLLHTLEFFFFGKSYLRVKMQNKSVPVMFEFVCRECNLFLIYFTFSFQRHVFNSVNFSALTHQFWSKLSPHTC